MNKNIMGLLALFFMAITPSISKMSGHIFTLYILRLFTGDNLLATRALVAVIFALSAPLMYLLARRFADHNRFALAIGAATIFWPPFLYYGSSLYSENLCFAYFCLGAPVSSDGLPDHELRSRAVASSSWRRTRSWRLHARAAHVFVVLALRRGNFIS